MSSPKQPGEVSSKVFASSTVWVTSGTNIEMSVADDATNWNATAKWAAAEKTPVMQSEMRFGGRPDSMIQFEAPVPNALRRFIWKWALGVEWKDLRPERALDELGKLK